MENSVSIPREDFLAMLKPLKRFAKKKEAGDAVLSMEGGDLVISLTGIATGAPATGNWSGEVSVPAKLLYGIAVMPPEGDPIQVAVLDGRLCFGTMSVSCSVLKTPRSSTGLRVDSEILKAMRLRYLYSPETLDRAGLTRTLITAQEKVRKIIERAVKILEPLGITESDLMRLVQEHVRRGLEKK